MVQYDMVALQADKAIAVYQPELQSFVAFTANPWSRPDLTLFEF